MNGENIENRTQDKKNKGMPTVISLFAGCGGSSLGYKLAGFKELLAIDWDNNSEQIFKLNFPNIPFWNKNIEEVNAKEILAFINLQKKELDILDGSPPCQGFSTAGKRKVQDPRNNLFIHFKRLVEGIQPKIFVMENVSGLVKGKMKGKFKQILKELKNTNYNVKCKLLNSKNYGVSQNRQRLFFIGIRKDIGKEFQFILPHQKIITVIEALKNCPEDTQKIQFTNPRLIRLIKMRSGENGSKYHSKGHYFNLNRAPINKPCMTITKTFMKQRCGILHPFKNRYLTISELKRLASFPDNFQFTGKFEEQWARIGNAVMPNQMKAIAKAIKEQILD